MTTPYDPALRIKQREIDELSPRIREEARRLADIDAALAELEAAVSRERALSAGDLSFPADRYRDRMRLVKATLQAERAAADDRLAELRGIAVSAVGARRALESAAEFFAEEELRVEESAEQIRLDDMTTAAIARRRKSLLQQQRP